MNQCDKVRINHYDDMYNYITQCTMTKVTNQLSVITNNRFLLSEILQHVLQIAETF